MDAASFDRYRDAWNSHDGDAVVEFFTDDGVYEPAALGRVSLTIDPRASRCAQPPSV